MAPPRKFDHDEARRLRADGWTYSAIGRKFGVTYNAVRRVCDPRANAAIAAASLRWHREHREPCRGGCGRLVWVTTHRDATGLCVSCIGDLMIRADHGTETSYSRGCRCPDCRDAASAARRRRRHLDPEAAAAYDRAYKARRRADRVAA